MAVSSKLLHKHACYIHALVLPQPVYQEFASLRPPLGGRTRLVIIIISSSSIVVVVVVVINEARRKELMLCAN